MQVVTKNEFSGCPRYKKKKLVFRFTHGMECHCVGLLKIIKNCLDYILTNLLVCEILRLKALLK